MDLLAHAIAQRGVNELVLPYFGEPRELLAHDHSLKVLPIATDFDMLAIEAGRDGVLDLFGSNHDAMPL